ncbi:MAG: hypothetical protein KDI88_00175 [Gammaproteobacteria bacterium]|nr:hypothetical protein [Gammaproteobacteria bacterium]
MLLNTRFNARLSRVHVLLCVTLTLPALADTRVDETAIDRRDFVTCPAIRIDGSQFAEQDRSLICDAAARAREFFRSFGIGIRQSIRIEASSEAGGLPHIGSFSLTDRIVRLTGQRRAGSEMAGDTLFGLPLNETLYRSVVVHELAHAIANQHFVDARPSLVAQEYIAYVAQLSTLETATRARILAANSLPAYASVDEMSSTYYAMDPSGFGIKVYRHFLSLDDPGAFLRGLLSGDIKAETSEYRLP